MQKNKKIILILILAFIVSVLGGVAIYFYLTPQKTTIYAFKENVSAGTVVTEDMLVPVQADSNIYFGGGKTDASDYYVTGENIAEVLKSGDSLRSDVVQGMPFTFALLTSGGGSNVEMQMDTSKIAITIPVTNVTGVTNELKVGSRVNVYATGGDYGEDYITQLLFQNMRVLNVGKDASANLNTVTLEVDSEQSMKLVYYSTFDTLYLGLVDGASYQYTDVTNPYYSPETGSVTKVDGELKEIDESKENTESTTEATTEAATETSTEETTEATEATEETTDESEDGE